MRGLWRFLAGSISNHFFEKTRPGWKVTISTNQGIGIPLLLHAREGISYLRPSLNSPSVKSDQWSPSLSSFTLFSVVSLSPCFSFLSLSLSLALALSRLSSLFNFHWKPRTTGHYPYRRRFQTRSRVQSRISGTKSSWPFRTFKWETPNSLSQFPLTKRATIRIVWFWRALTEHVRRFPRTSLLCTRNETLGSMLCTNAR